MQTLAVLNATCLDVVESQRQWIESLGVKLLAEQSFRSADRARLKDILRDVDAIILPASVRAAPSDQEMADAPRLKVCAIAASGYEWLDVTAATRHGIVVTYAPGGEGAEVVADLTWGLLLAATRQIVHHHNLLSRGDGTRGMGTGVSGKTLGIVGIGAIGKEVALRAKGFRMNVLAHDPYADRAFTEAHNIKLVPMEQLLCESDFVTLHVRLTEETRNMISAPQLGMMKKNAFIINAARQELIDEQALADAIVSGHLGGAGLDDPPGEAGKKLFGHPGVVFTTHLGNRALEGVIAVFRSAVESAVAVLRGQRPKFVVNPKVYDGDLRGAAVMQKS
jgi:phosphoglycerate dehydrogenase-like enzyme